jgi:RNA polymerase sigma-70 factor (ECF subfamily)
MVVREVAAVSLSTIYVEVRKDGSAASDPLENALAAAVQGAQQAHPEILCSAEALVAYVAERAAHDEARWDDLLLAMGCLRGDPHALGALEREILPEVRGALHKLRLPAAAVEDALQSMSSDLLSGPSPKIASYEGKGRLGAWMRVVATRLALRADKRDKRYVHDDEPAALAVAAGADPELSFMKEQYRAEFRAAVADAIAAIAPKSALVLRQHTVDGLSIDEIGALHQVHRATAARWVQAAREELLAEIRRCFVGRCKIAPDECDSVLRLVQSRLDVTVRRHLVEAAKGPQR